MFACIFFFLIRIFVINVSSEVDSKVDSGKEEDS